MTAVLFAGPTLHGLWSRIPAGIRRLPPARAGDIAAALARGASRIGLVDGLFGDTRSVWHKEILLALSQGVPVLGAASLGALRAADCAAFGMQPVGRIAAEYLAGRRMADADVALLHAPAELDFAPLTLALADAEFALSRLLRQGRIAAPLCERLLASARGMHFSVRTWGAVLSGAGVPAGQTAGLGRLLAGTAPGQKARDALALTRLLPTARPRLPLPEAIETGQFRALLKRHGQA